jgi:uncharacterized protein YwqG
MRLFGSTAEVSKAIKDVGLDQWHDQLLGLARPTVRYVANASAGHAAVGASRVGGTPDLPPQLKWPTRPPYPDADVRNIEVRDHPAKALHTGAQKDRDRRRDEIIAKNAFLPFIAQIDLAHAWRLRPFDIDLPKEGRLLFFYDAREVPFGFVLADMIGFRVLWDHAPVSALSRAAAPAELKIDALVLPAKTLHGASGLALPEWETFAYEALRIPNQYSDQYDRLLHPFADLPYEEQPDVEKLPNHYVGGWGEPRQSGHMELECELVRLGFSVDTRSDDEKNQASLRQADWCLLAQFNCEEFHTEGLEHEWFTSLELYFWIKRDDLAARRFERTWIVVRS